MALIGYTCSYVPVEILAATGHRPYRLLHAEVRLAQDGEQYVRVDACPLIKSTLAYLSEHRTEFACVVGTSGCDMSRRMYDVLAETTDLPVLLLDNPRTDRFAMYSDEIDWLIREIERLFSLRITPEMIRREIGAWEDARTHYRALDRKRMARPSRISTAELHKAVTHYHKGEIEFPPFVPEEATDRPRVYLLGSAFPFEANSTLRLFEERLRVAGDFNCGISRFLGVQVANHSLAGLKRAYFEQPSCILKRPDHRFYEHVSRSIAGLDCRGIIAWTLDYCDPYEFELKRIESKLGLPVLRLRSDLSTQNLAPLKTRIEAFADMIT